MATRLLAVHCEVTTGYSCNRHYSQTKDSYVQILKVTMVTRLHAVHYEVTTGYSCNRHYSRTKDKVMSRFLRLQWLQGYLLYIVKLQQVTVVTDIIQKQRYSYVQILKLTRVTRLLAVHCEVTTGYSYNRHYSQTKDIVMSRF